MDEPSFYGFPCYGEATVKAAQDCGGPGRRPGRPRTFEPDAAWLALLAGLHGDGSCRVRAGRSVDALPVHADARPRLRDGPVPGHVVLVGLGAGHGFKFAPTIGRMLADLASRERDSISPTFALDRPGLTDPTYAPNWLV